MSLWLDALWLYAVGIAAGAAALAAAIRLSGGRWAGALLPKLDAIARWLPPIALLLVPLAILCPPPFPRGPLPWIRDEVAAVGLAVAAWRLKGGLQRHMVGYLLVYALTMSVFAFDRVLQLAPWEPITILPAGYMVGALLSALAVGPLLAARDPAFDAKMRGDVGALLFALTTFWAYLLWSAWLPAWYGNMPEEAEPFLARAQGPFLYLGAFALAATVALPFGLLMRREWKRSRAVLSLAAALVTVGFLAERLVLVLPTAVAAR